MVKRRTKKKNKPMATAGSQEAEQKTETCVLY
jgi:hypothetical protein